MLSLSLFGLPHIYYELVYIRRHVAAILPRPLLVAVLSILSFLVIVKMFNLLSPFHLIAPIELLCLVSLLLIGLYFSSNGLTIIVLLIACSVLIVNAALLLLILACLHNLTPWGFLSVHQASRRAWIIFIVNPCLVFLLAFWLTADATLFSIPQRHLFLSHYTYSSFNATTLAFFAAAVYLQMVHYYFVIRVLPQRAKLTLTLHPAAAVGFLLFTSLFFYAFSATKSVYAVAALFHAYLEIPLLLYLLPLAGKLTAKFDQITSIIKK